MRLTDWIRPHRRVLSLLSILFLAGCGESEERDEVISLDKIPPAAMEAANKALPDVGFNSAWIEKEKDGIAYEIRGRNSRGKIRDVKVTPDGKVLEVD